MLPHSIDPKKILVFLPRAAVGVIVAKLAEHGHDTIAASTVPELLDALNSDCCAFAVTTRLEIDLVRNIRAIPIVNLEIFFHAEPSSDGLMRPSKRFDGRAFMQRINFLKTPVTERADRGNGVRSKESAPVQVSRLPRWWTASRLALPR
jgi:hypothetical protein